MTRGSFESRLIRSFDEFDSVHDEWNRLADLLGSPLLRHDWYASCARAFHDEADLAVTVVWRGSELVAAAPLVKVGHLVRQHLEILGSRALYEPGGLLYSDEEALAVLVRRILAIGPPVALDRIDFNSPVRQIFSAQPARRAVVFQRRTAASLAVLTDGDWPTYTRGLSSKFRRNLARLRRRAGEVGAVTTEFLAPGPEEIDGILDTVMAIEASGWKGRRGSAMLRNEAVGLFFRVYGRLSAARGELRVTLLRIGQTIAAAEVAVEAHRRQWLLKIGYDEGLSRHSPGLLLRFDTLAHAFSNGLQAMEFLGAAEVLEERWNPVARRYVLVVAYPMSAQGLWQLAVDATCRAIRLVRNPRRHHISRNRRQAEGVAPL